MSLVSITTKTAPTQMTARLTGTAAMEPRSDVRLNVPIVSVASSATPTSMIATEAVERKTWSVTGGLYTPVVRVTLSALRFI